MSSILGVFALFPLIILKGQKLKHSIYKHSFWFISLSGFFFDSSDCLVHLYIDFIFLVKTKRNLAGRVWYIYGCPKQGRCGFQKGNTVYIKLLLFNDAFFLLLYCFLGPIQRPY